MLVALLGVLLVVLSVDVFVVLWLDNSVALTLSFLLGIYCISLFLGDFGCVLWVSFMLVVMLLYVVVFCVFALF